MKHHEKKRSRGVSGLEREAEREELRKIRSRRAFGYAGRIHARLPERFGRYERHGGLPRMSSTATRESRRLTCSRQKSPTRARRPSRRRWPTNRGSSERCGS